VHYAIADLAAFITPGDPVDVEANRRGETLYGADSKVPLHPRAISEDAGHLLADQVRPALLWTLTLDNTGEGTEAKLERALVRSRAKLSYDEVQKSVDEGRADELFTLLQEIGELPMDRERRNGGVNLPLPEQDIDVVDDR
jgi:exoribonuclease R